MSTLAPFAAVEALVNQGSAALLNNATATFSGRTFGCIFDQPYSSPFDGQVDASDPTLQASSTDLAGATHGSDITVNGRAFTVIRAEPDGTGMTQLILAEKRA